MKATLAPIAALLVGTAFLITGHGLQLTLVPLRAEAEGWTALQIGALGSAYYVGFIAGCILSPYLVLRAGHIRTFTAMVSLTAAAIIAHPLWVAFIPWLVFRLLIGASLAGLYLIIESWLNDSATNKTRGIVMSAYIMVNFSAITIGQLMVTLTPPTGFELFAAATLVVVLAAIPVALTRSAQPAPVTLVRFRPLALYRSSPVGVVGVGLIGFANGAFWSLGAYSAVGTGLTAAGAATFMSIATAAGALSQWPAGRISDRIDRRFVLIGLLLLAMLAGLALAFLPLPQTGRFVLAFLLGCFMLPTYSIAAAHAYDHATPGSYVETAAGILLVNAVGAAIGPLLASPLMGQFGPSMLFLFTAIMQAILAAFAFSRIAKRPAPEGKTDFDLAATAPVGAVIPPELLDPENPNIAIPEGGETRKDEPEGVA